MKIFRYRFTFMRVSNIKVIYKVMIKRLVLTLGFPFSFLLGACFGLVEERTLELILNIMISNILVLCFVGSYL